METAHRSLSWGWAAHRVRLGPQAGVWGWGGGAGMGEQVSGLGLGCLLSAVRTTGSFVGPAQDSELFLPTGILVLAEGLDPCSHGQAAQGLLCDSLMGRMWQGSSFNGVSLPSFL